MSRKFGTAVLLPGNPSAALEAAPKQYVDKGDVGKVFNVMAYGAVGDGTTNDTSAINSAIAAADAAGKGIIWFPEGVYLVSSTIQLTGGNHYQGAGGRGQLSTIKAAAGLTGGAVCAAYGWYNNATSADQPILFEGIQIDCNSVSGVHGLVIFNFWSRVHDVQVTNCNGSAANAFYATDLGRNGTTQSTNSHSENTWTSCRVATTTNYANGFRAESNNGASNQDGHILDSFFSGVAGHAISIGRAAGWTIENNHLYGIGLCGMFLSNCYSTKIIGNYIEDFGGSNSTTDSTSGYYAGISLETVLNGRGCILANNTVSTAQPSSPTGNRWVCYAARAGSGQTNAKVVYCGNSAAWAVSAPATNRSWAYKIGEGGDSGRMLYVEYAGNQVDSTIAWQNTRYRDVSTTTLAEPIVGQDPNIYPLSAYGLITSSFHIDNGSSVANGITINTIEIYRMWIPPNTVITGAATIVSTAGVTPGSANASGFRLYSDDGQTVLAQHTDDYTIFTTAGLRSKAFTTALAAVPYGRWVRLAMIHTCTTIPKFLTGFAMGASLLNTAQTGTHRRGIFQTSVTSWPATFAPATYGTNDSPPVFMALY